MTEKWKRTLLFLWLLQFFSASGIGLAMPFLPLYIQKLGAGKGGPEFWAGLSLGITFIGMGLMQPVWGAWADRWGRKAMVLRAAFGSAAAVGMLATAHSVYEIFAWRAIHGLFGGFVAASNALMACVAPAAYVGRAMAALYTAMVAGMLTGPLVGGPLADRLGYRACFLLTAGFIFLGAMAVAIGVPRDRGGRGDGKTAAGPLENLRAIRKHRTLLPLLACQMTSQIALMSVFPVLSLFVGLFSPAAWKATYAGFAYAASSVTMLATAWLWGRRADRSGHSRVFALCLAGCCLSYLPMGFARTVWQIIGLRLLIGVFMGGLSPAGQGLIAVEAKEERRAGIMGAMAGMTLFGTAFGPILGGWIGHQFGLRWVFFFATILLGIAWRLSRSIPPGRPEITPRLLEAVE